MEKILKELVKSSRVRQTILDDIQTRYIVVAKLTKKEILEELTHFRDTNHLPKLETNKQIMLLKRTMNDNYEEEEELESIESVSFSEEEEEEIEEVEEEIEEVGTTSSSSKRTLSEQCMVLDSLSSLYCATNQTEPLFAAGVFKKLKILSSEISPDPDTFVFMTDEIVKLGKNVPKQMFAIGKLAKEYYVDKYRTLPPKVERTINGETKFINGYTVQTAPDTLHKAILELL